jgi:hypothetical protein
MTPFDNLCMPDAAKSCAACCGLYNVADARRDTLQAVLTRRTELFLEIPRTTEAILDYETRVVAEEDNPRLDPDIHVCVFTGFTDDERRTPGCMLHPSLPLNKGMDYRGLCHYGSLACRTFYCPAWETAASPEMRALIPLIDDWHLYGLVMTDLPFLRSVFALLGIATEAPLDYGRLSNSPALPILVEIVSWKDRWPFHTTSTLRRSRYYLKDERSEADHTEEFLLRRILDAVDFTYGMRANPELAIPLIRDAAQRFAEAY